MLSKNRYEIILYWSLPRSGTQETRSEIERGSDALTSS